MLAVTFNADKNLTHLYCRNIKRITYNPLLY